MCPGGNLLDSYSISSNVVSSDLYDTTGFRSEVHCLSRNLTVRASRNTPFWDHRCVFNHSAASPTHCLTGNLPLSASNPSFPPTLHWSVLQGRKVAHQLWNCRRTWRPLERKRKNFHEATRGRSLSSPHTDRPLRVSSGGERGQVIELSGKT